MKRSIVCTLILLLVYVFSQAQIGVFQKVISDSVFSKDYRFRSIPNYSLLNATTNIISPTTGTYDLTTPPGTTAQRPTVPAGKYILRYNTDSAALEIGNPSQVWKTLSMSSVQTFDTTSISNFGLKVRSLFSASAPLQYNAVTGNLTIPQATSSTSGYLASSDWVVFNSRLPDPGSNGLVARTAAGTTQSRQLVAGSVNVTLNNANGVSGNPVIDLNDTLILSQLQLPYIPAALSTADSALFLNRTTGLLEVRPVPNGTSGGINNGNIGSGFRWLDSTTQKIKTVFSSNTIGWDSTSNTNGLTAKVDTSVIATQYDLTLLTAANGITRNSNTFELGGTLNQNTTINTTSAYSLNVNGNNTGITTGNLYLYNSGTTGTALFAETNGGYAGRFHAITSGAASTSIPVLSIGRGGGSVSNGIGTILEFKNQTTVNGFNSANTISNQLISKWTDATDATRTSQFEIWGVNSTISARKMAIFGTGQITVDGYTGSNFQTIDTSFNTLVVDGSGNIYKRAGGGGGGAGGGGGSTLNNIGSGYRWVATPTGNIKTFFTDATGSIDSTSNTNGLTYKVDTGIIATQNDIIGKSYYVAQSGISTGSGSTIGTAVNMARLIELSSEFVGGERIFFKANDTLRGSVTIKANTYISRYDTGRAPIIAGTIRSTSLTWTQSGTIWKARSTTRVGRLLRNGVPEKTAQSAYYEVTNRPASDQVTASSATGLGSWVTQSEMISKEYNFRFKHNTITAYNSGTGNFTINSDNGIVVGYSFKLFNHDQLISSDGDWAWVNDTVYYKSPGNVNPNTLDVELSVHETGLAIERGASGVTINNIKFYAQALNGIDASQTNNVVINNCIFNKQLNAAVFSSDSSVDLHVTNSVIDSVANCGILFGQNITYAKIDGNKITHIGMQVDPPFARQNVIPFQNGVNGIGVMMFPNCDYAIISNNRIDSLAYNGIIPQGSFALIDKNEISNFDFRQNDGGGIHCGADSAFYFAVYGWHLAKSSSITNNIIYNGVGGNEGGPVQQSHAMGIYADNGTLSCKIIGNTVYNNTGSGIYNGFNNKDNEISGNISYANIEAQFRVHNDSTSSQFYGGLNVHDNTFVALSSTQRCMLFVGAVLNPFDRGACINNTLISPYTNNVVKQGGTDYTLSTARTQFNVNFGQKDDYSASYVNDSTAKANVKLDVNLSPQSRWSIMPENFRSTVNKYSNQILSPNSSTIWVTALRDFVVNHNSAATVMSFKKDNVENAILGISNGANQLINGSVANDFNIRSVNSKILLSTDEGITASMAIDVSSNIGVGTAAPTYRFDVQTNTASFERYNIKNSSSSGGALFQALNNNDFGLQTGVFGSTVSAGFNSANDVFFASNTAAGSNFNIFSSAAGNIRFGMYNGSSVQEVMRINTSSELQIGSTSDVGAFTLQNTGGLYQNGAVTMNIGSDATGDIYYRNSGGAFTRLGIGSNGDVLTVSSGLPSWSASSGATTIYNGDGTLSGNRILTGAANDLTLTGIDQFKVASTYYGQAKSDGSRVYSSAIGITSSQAYQFGYSGSIVGSFPIGVGFMVDTLNNIGLGDITPATSPLYSNGNSTYVAWGLQSGNANYFKVSNITTNTTLNNLNYNLITVDATSGNVTITLPAASASFGNNMGLDLIFKRLDSSGNTVTIQRAGSDTIDGGTSFTLPLQYDSKAIRAISTSTWAIHN